MDFPKPKYDREVSRLTKEYKKALVEVTDRVVELATLPLSELDKRQTDSIVGQLSYVLKNLDEKNKEFVERNIKKAYQEGQAHAILELGDAESIYEASRLISFSTLSVDTLNSIMSDTYEDLLYATRHTEERVKRVVRSAVSDTMKSKAPQQLGRRTMVREIKNELTKKGLSKKLTTDGWVGIVDRAGRRWNLNTYADMVVRTKLTQAYTEGKKQEGRERGYDLAVISSHGATDACSQFEGAIISMNGDTKGYPTYDDLWNSNLIFHPNCKHSVSLTRDPSLLPKEVLDKAEKQTRNAVKVAGTKDYKGVKSASKPTKKASSADTSTNTSPYREFGTIEEANAWAKQHLGIAHVDYTGYDIRLANEMNKTLYELRQRYPEVKATKWVGTAQTRNREFVKEEKNKLLLQGYSKASVDKWGRSTSARIRVSANNYASSTNKQWGRFEGIAWNADRAKDYDGLVSTITRDVMANWHPQGTGVPSSVITHEFAHQIDNFLKDNNLRGKINTIYATYTKADVVNGLCRYGSKNTAEFFAEAMTEYIHSATPREIAKTVGEAVDEIFKGIRVK